MSDSPASRPKRSSAFSSFYIDEDDFEDDYGSSSSHSSKIEKEDVFVAEKIEANDSDSSESEIEEFDTKPAAKVKSKQIKKQNAPKVVAPKKPKSITMKNSSKIVPNTKSTDEDDFELVVEGVDSSDHESKTVITDDENFDGDNNLKKLKSKPVAKKAKITPQTKLPCSLKPKTEILLNRPKLPSSIAKVKIPGQWNGPRRVGLSKSAPTRPLSPVKLKKIN